MGTYHVSHLSAGSWAGAQQSVRRQHEGGVRGRMTGNLCKAWRRHIASVPGEPEVASYCWSTEPRGGLAGPGEASWGSAGLKAGRTQAHMFIWGFSVPFKFSMNAHCLSVAWLYCLQGPRHPSFCCSHPPLSLIHISEPTRPY